MQPRKVEIKVPRRTNPGRGTEIPVTRGSRAPKIRENPRKVEDREGGKGGGGKENQECQL